MIKKEKYHQFVGVAEEPKPCASETIMPPHANGFLIQFFPSSDCIDCNSKTTLHKKLVRDDKTQSTSANMTNWWVMLSITQLLPFTPGDVSEERAN
jgi:hypothetical protein